MKTISVEVFGINTPVIYHYSKEFLVICDKNMDFKNLIICKKEDLVQNKNLEIQLLQKEINDLKIKIEKLKNKDYKNRALKASLTRSNQIIKLLTA